MTAARTQQHALDAVDVHLDAAELELTLKVGRLSHRHARGQSTMSFVYAAEWLTEAQAFPIDPRLGLYAGEQFAVEPKGNFGIFLDSAPDRWGRVLMERREVLAAREEQRPVRTLTEWDYLLGVQDECRMGALRFRHDDVSPFLDHGSLPVPPVTSLAELEAVSLAPTT